MPIQALQHSLLTNIQDIAAPVIFLLLLLFVDMNSLATNSIYICY
jgi:hypothetical protein